MLTIVNVAFPFAPVSPASVGGAEQVVVALDRALCAAGHRSLVVANATSRVGGELIGIPVPQARVTEPLRAEVSTAYRVALAEVIARERPDVVHFHGVDCARYLAPSSVPSVVTLHLAAAAYDAGLFHAAHRLCFTCVSSTQRAQLPAHVLVEDTIENGVDLDLFCPVPSPRGGYAACLGRVCPEKGYDVALRAARAAPIALAVAGVVFPYAEHERHFAESIRPLLDRHRTFVGPVSGSARRHFLANAECLIVPSRAPETSSLVTMEALACGTPVLASDRGALPSLLEPGVTGFVFSSEHELVDALRQRRSLDRAACRKSAEKRFDVRVGTARYIDLYERVARRAALAQTGLAS